MSAYWELALPVSDEAAEGLTNFLWELGALGVVQEQPGEGPSCLRAFFPQTADGPGLERQVVEYVESLCRLGFAPCGRPRLAPLPDGHWAEAWREHFRPLALGRRLLVAPPWQTPLDGSRLTVVIEPGRAFGTGHHGTTAGCLEALELIVEAKAPARALDLGTGSGILAIAAARLGVDSVLAVDEDPDATAAATANAARNAVADRVRCLTADAGTLDVPPTPLVLANLLSAAHRRLAPAYARYVAGGGALLLGGILEGESADVVIALAPHGFDALRARTVDGWTTLELTRR